MDVAIVNVEKDLRIPSTTRSETCKQIRLTPGGYDDWAPTMSSKSDPTIEDPLSLHRINRSDGKKWRPSGSASKVSLRRAQSSRILYFFSSSSSKSSNGVHSKMIKPGAPSPASTVGAGGPIRKTLSDNQVPEDGTPNFRWSQMAVPSLS